MTRALHSDQVKEEMDRCGCPPWVTSVSGDKLWRGGCVQGSSLEGVFPVNSGLQ